MECPKCQHDNAVGAKFCNECAAPLPLICSQCGRVNTPGSNFCNECAHDLSKLLPSDSTASLESTQTGASEGERRQATIVFSDLTGYTAMSEKLDPEEVEAIMSRIKVEAVRIVETHGGIVNQFVGDEVLALFGIPIAHEDDPSRAVRAALELHDLVRTFSPEVEEKTGAPLRMHTGINTGLIVTHLRDDREGRYGITGDTVNTAARLVGLAKTDEILASHETRRLIAPFFTTEVLEPVSVKGKVRSVTPYRVIEDTAVGSRFEAAQRQGFTPFAGREAELATLNTALDMARSGRGQFVTVSGDAGVGKSRLLYEFRHSIDRARVTILEGRCQSYGTATPYHPFLNSLHRGLQLSEEDDPGELHEKVVRNALAIDSALEQYLPYYLRLLSIPSEKYKLPPFLEGLALQRAFEEALAEIILATARIQPLVAIYEDWHWADEASDEGMKNMVEHIAGNSIMVVILHRPEYRGDWDGVADHTTLALNPLGSASIEAIVRARLNATELPEGLADKIHERTGGNPFFAEELCDSLVEEETIKFENDRVRLTRSLESLTLPNNVQAVIRARLDRLNPNQQEALRLASVIGREFALSLLGRLHSDRGRLTGSLDGLTAQDIIRQIRALPDRAYTFKHVLTQVVVYETLLLQRRRELHGLLGRVIEELYADNLEAHCESLAYHYARSADRFKAVEFLEMAGRKAARNSTMPEARRHYIAAIELLDSLEPAPEIKRQRIDISLKLARGAYVYYSDDLYDLLKQSVRYAEELTDDLRLVRSTFGLATMKQAAGELEQAIALFERCIELAEASKDEVSLAFAKGYLGSTLALKGETGQGIVFLEEAVSVLSRLQKYAVSSLLSQFLILVYGERGEFEKGLSMSDKLLPIAKNTGNRQFLAYIFSFRAVVLMNQGDLPGVINSAEQSLELFRKLKDPWGEGIALSLKGFVTFLMGDSEDGISLCRASLDRAIESGSRLGLGFQYGALAEMLAISGATDEARAKAQKALSDHQQIGIALANRALAIAATAFPPDWTRADEQMGEGLRVTEEFEERPVLAITHFRYAEILHKKGDLDAAGEQLDRAQALFADLGMMWWPEQAESLRARIERGEPFQGFAPYFDKPVS